MATFVPYSNNGTSIPWHTGGVPYPTFSNIGVTVPIIPPTLTPRPIPPAPLPGLLPSPGSFAM